MKNEMPEAKVLGNLENTSLGSISDKQVVESSAKSTKKHTKTVHKTLKVQMKPIKETSLLGEEEVPEQRTESVSAKADVQKKLKNLDELLWDDVLGEGKRAPSAHLQEMGKDVGLTPMKIKRNRR